MKLPPNVLRISDRSCMDCGGEVEFFGVVDKVWNALIYPPSFNAGEESSADLEDWICLDCFERRLNPDRPATSPDELRAQIVRRRRRFRLEARNVYGGSLNENRAILPLNRSLLVVTSPNIRSLTADDANTNPELDLVLA